MPDVEQTQQPDNNVTINQTVDVLDAKGKTIDRSASPLADIFNKIEAGKKDGVSAEETLKAEPPVQQQKVTETVKEPEVKKQPTELEQRLNKTEQKEEEKVELTEKEVSRNKMFEKEDRKTDKKAEPKVDEQPSNTDVTEEELQVLPHDKPKTAKRIEALLKKIGTITAETTKTRAEAAEKAAKLAELEKKLSETQSVDPKVQEEMKRKEEELAMYRRRYDLDKDPEIKTKYDAKIEAAEKAIPDILKRNGAPEGLLKLIEEEGGWQKFTRSPRVITLADGKQLSAAELADTVVAQVPFADRSQIQSLTTEQIQLQRAKESFLKEEQGKASEYFKRAEEQTKKQQEEQQKQYQEQVGKIETWYKETVDKNEWLKVKEIPSGLTAEQKAAIEEDNKYAKQYNSLLKQSINVKTIDDAFEVALDSVRYFQVRRENAKLQDELAKTKEALKQKEDQIVKIKSSSRSTPKAGSIAGGGGNSTVGGTVEKKTPQTLEQAFDAIGRGEILSSKDSDE